MNHAEWSPYDYREGNEHARFGPARSPIPPRSQSSSGVAPKKAVDHLTRQSYLGDQV